MTQTAGITSAAAIYIDTVSLIAPVIDFTGGVSVTAGDNYTLSASGPGNSTAASIAFTILTINGNTAPASYQDSQNQLTPGTSSGQLSLDFTILACPCSFQFSISGSANAGPTTNSASFQDPFFITLPPGWTYTLASQQPADTPEPATVAVLLGGLCLMLGLRRIARASGPAEPAR